MQGQADPFGVKKPMRQRRIIVADDEAYVTATIAGRLRQLGDQVVTVCNGQQAFDLACQNPPDLIIADYQMPVLDGYQMSLKLKQDPRTFAVPVIMLTARGHKLPDEQLAATSIRTLLAKPFSMRELLARIEQFIGPPADTTAKVTCEPVNQN